MSHRRRLLREFDDFERAAAEVIKRCAPHPFRGLMKHVGGWTPPDSIQVVSPPLLYNIAIGVGRNKWNLRLERQAREERAAVVIPLFEYESSRVARRVRASATKEMGVPWLPNRLDGESPGHPGPPRLGFEPNVAEFCAGDFGVHEPEATP